MADRASDELPRRRGSPSADTGPIDKPNPTRASVAVDITLGPRLRAARLRKGLSMEELTRLTGLTKGFISQIERDMSAPSIPSLIKIANALEITIGSLFDSPATNLVRESDRVATMIAGPSLVEYLLTPSSERRVEIILSQAEPGGGAGDELASLSYSVEACHVLRGSIELVVRDERYLLERGDTMTYSPRDPHTWRNASDAEPAEVLWVSVP